MFKNQVEHKTAIGIRALIGEVVKLTAGEAAVRKISVQMEVTPAGQRVIGDTIQLQQCVLNLVMNAFDAIADANTDRRGVTVQVAPEKTGWVGVSVCDSGAGIDPASRTACSSHSLQPKAKGWDWGCW